MDTKRIKKEVIKKLDAVINTDFKNIYSKLPNKQNPRGVSNITEAHDKAGVYIILEKSNGDKDGEIVYVGMSSYDLYKTIHRHFQKWKDKEQRNRISYKDRIINNTHTYEIAIVYTTPKTAKLLEKELINIYLPRDNKEKL